MSVANPLWDAPRIHALSEFLIGTGFSFHREIRKETRMTTEPDTTTVNTIVPRHAHSGRGVA